MLTAAALLAVWFETETDGTVKLFDVRLVGANPNNAKKLLFTVIFIAAVVLLNYILRGIARLIVGRMKNDRVIFWTRQGIRLAMAILLVFGIASIWFSDPTRLATALGLVTAGVAFALQKVITSFAGYLVILRGRSFAADQGAITGEPFFALTAGRAVVVSRFNPQTGFNDFLSFDPVGNVTDLCDELAV